MKPIPSLLVIVNVLFAFQVPVWAQNFERGQVYETITPRSDENYWTPKRMRDAKPMPMPTVPEDYRHRRKGQRYETITPRSDENYWTPKRMRDAKPMPMPTVPRGHKRSIDERARGPQQIPMDTDAQAPRSPVMPYAHN